MKLRHIFLISIIVLLTYIGYTFQPNTIPFEQDFSEEIVDEMPDYSKEIEDFLTEYESFFTQKFSEYGSVGGALTIVYKGQIVLIKPYGVKKMGTTDSVDNYTVFRLASVSKGFTGVLASKLHLEKKINLDTTIISYLPDFTLKKAQNHQQLSLKQTLSHTTGLVAYSFDPSIESGASFNKIYHNLRIANIDSKPGQRYAYQNVMFSLIDTISQVALGKSYETLIKEQLFTPLGMTTASVSFEDFTASNNFAYPHKGWKKSLRTVRLNDRYYQTKPAAGINASIADLSKWLQALMGQAPNIISPEVIQYISQPVVESPVKYISSKTWGKLDKKEYGVGWRVLTVKNNKVLYHGGFVEGYRAEIAFFPDKQIGIAMLLNSPNMLAIEAVPCFVKSYITYLETKKNDSPTHSVSPELSFIR